MRAMTRLALTTDASAAGGLRGAGLADVAIALQRRLVSGKPLFDAEQAAFFAAAHPARQDGPHWLDDTPEWRVDKYDANGCGLVEFCGRFESVALWIDPDPNAQLTLVWLLDYLRSHEMLVSRLTLIQADSTIGDHTLEQLAKSAPPAVDVRNDHVELAGKVWRAHNAATPRAWFDLLSADLSALPRLRQTVETLLEELPGHLTGLAATEMRMLALLAEGHAHPFDLFPGDNKPNERRTFEYWEVGALLDGLARCPSPAVSGLEEGPFTLDMHDSRDRHNRYKESRLSLTDLGKAILAHSDDFSRHNPIHRWWGGTELTNDRLWRWDPSERTLIEP
jgi:hypothetical protein